MRSSSAVIPARGEGAGAAATMDVPIQKTLDFGYSDMFGRIRGQTLRCAGRRLKSPISRIPFALAQYTSKDVDYYEDAAQPSSGRLDSENPRLWIFRHVWSH
jgi:hypothetical protein